MKRSPYRKKILSLVAIASIFVAHSVGVKAYEGHGSQQPEVVGAKNITQSNRSTARAHLDSGLELERKGDLVGAVGELQAAVQADPDLPEVYYHLGRIFGQQSDFDEAKAKFQTALRLRPDYSEACHAMGVALMANPTKDLELSKATSYLRRAVELDPKDAQAQADLGNALASQGDLQGAISRLQIAISLKPNFAQAHYSLADMLHRYGDTNDALAELRAALELNPDLPKAHHLLAVMLSRRGDKDAALRQLREELKTNPDSEEAHYLFGRLLLQAGNQAAGSAELKRANALRDRRLEKVQAIKYNNSGLSLAQKGEVAAGIAALRTAVQLNPAYADAHYNLGLALATNGDLRGATDELINALRLRPTNARIHFNLGRVRHQVGDLQGAIQEFQTALKLEPAYKEAQDALNNVIGRRPGSDRARSLGSTKPY